MHLNIDPIIFSLFGFPILRWYSLAYILGFLSAYFLFQKLTSFTTKQQTESLFNYGFFGVILGGRFGYALFYNLPYYFSNPLEVFAVWQGGMSFHGGLIGVVVGLWICCHKHKIAKRQIADIAPVCVAPGLFFGRIANFMNGELWGAKTDLPWGIIFPYAGNFPRHPSQLYEAFFEGLVIFIACIWFYLKKKKPDGTNSALFMVLYGVFRFMIEFIRQPDEHLGYILFNTFTMGHLLCFAMVITGLALNHRLKKTFK